jgi:hypothetical protein
VATTAQLRIEPDSTRRFLIDSTNNAFQFYIDTTPYVVILDPGWYASASALIAALDALIQSAFSQAQLTFSGIFVSLLLDNNYGNSGVGTNVNTPPDNDEARRLHSLLGFDPSFAYATTPISGSSPQEAAVADSRLLEPNRSIYVRDMQARVRPFTRRYKR